MLRVAFYLPNLKAGGAEVVAVTLAKYWAHNGFQVEIIVNQKEGDLLNTLPDSIDLICLECNKIRHGLLPLYHYFSKTNADIFIAYMWPLTITAIFAAKLAKFKGKLVTSDHTTFSKAPILQSHTARLIFLVTVNLVYRLADSRLVVSQGAAEDLASLSKLKKDKFTVIGNPVTKHSYSLSMDTPNFWDNKKKRILAVGSLKWAKNYPLLLHAFKKVLAVEEAVLCIVGQGELYDELADLISTLDIEHAVHLVGYQENPLAWMAISDVLVLSSHYEGFANVIIESLSVGTPVISVDCPHGPKEILKDGEFGTLVPNHDVQALADALMDSFTKKYDVNVLKKHSENFSVESIASQYLDKIVGKA